MLRNSKNHFDKFHKNLIQKLFFMTCSLVKYFKCYWLSLIIELGGFPVQNRICTVFSLCILNIFTQHTLCLVLKQN